MASPSLWSNRLVDGQNQRRTLSELPSHHWVGMFIWCKSRAKPTDGEKTMQIQVLLPAICAQFGDGLAVIARMGNNAVSA